jgi:thiopeptide-type bacteriocin biosynthesis protein
LAPTPVHSVAWGPRENWLLAILSETLTYGSHELKLTREDIERLSVPNPLPLPDAFAVMARLEACPGEAAGRGDFRLYLAGVSGPSGARLLGRFCHADPELEAAVAEHLRVEEEHRPDAVFAEVAHLPEGRLGNILARPQCRPFEIPYLGRSGACAERVLSLSDLTVSVRGPRVILRSKRLAREVLPRLTSAHNFATSHGVYRFLCALQGQGVVSGLGWTWGPLMGSAYLPRVTYGRLVLARAQWRVLTAEIKTLLAGTAEDRWSAVQLWRAERRLPRWVCLSDGDHELPIDLDNRLMVEMLLGELRGRDSVILIEMFPAPDQLCLEGPDGRRVHELVVPFARQPGAERERRDRPAPAQSRGVPTCRRMFPPGSDWLTIKLYAGSIAVDHLLRDVVGPLAIRFVREGLARRWFFVRYADPHGHVRLRFQGEPDVLNIKILTHVQAAVAPLLADGRIWKMQLDTYEREVERYGGPVRIALCEQLFHHDSEAVIELLRLLADDQRGDRRWRFALLGMDRLLNDLGLDPDARQQLLGRLRESARLESGIEGEASRRLSAKYRTESMSVEALLDFSAGAEWADAQSIFDSRTQRNAAPVSALQRHARLGLDTVDIADLAAPLLHMHANRLLRSAQRMHETVLYDFLFRYDHRTQSLHRNRTACGSGYVV